MKAKLRLILFAAAIATLLMPSSVPAQRIAKRALTHNDYDSWRTIQSFKLSRDGKFLVYALVPQDGDTEVVARNLTSGSEWRKGVGTRPPQTNTVDDETGAPAAQGAPSINV